GTIEPGDRAHEARLACPRGSDDDGDQSGRSGERHVVEHERAATSHRQPVDHHVGHVSILANARAVRSAIHAGPVGVLLTTMRIPFLADDRTAADDLPDADDVVDVTAPFLPAGEHVVGHSDRGRLARWPWEVPWQGWKDIGMRVKEEWGDDNVGMAAAAVAFYSFLAIIPAMAALVSILGLVAYGRDPEEVIEDLFGALPDEAQQLMSGQLESITASSSSALSFGLAIAIALSIWTASGAMSQLMNTINIVYDEEETRGWVRRKLIALGLTFGAIVFVAAAVF